MALETEEVRELVDFSPEGFLVTSFYLNVSAVEFPSPDHIRQSFDSLRSTADEQREQWKGEVSHDAYESSRADMDKIKQFVTEDFERTDTNGLAIFSCSAQDFWHVLQMPTPVESEVFFGPRPHVGPVAAFLSHTKATAILLTDKQQARIITMHGGEVREWADIDDFVPQRSAQGGWSQMRYQRRSDNWARHHVDRAAELVLKLKQHYPFDWLILGTEVQRESDLQADLHPYLKDIVIGEIHVRVDAPMAEVVQQAEEVREQAESQLIDRLMEQVQEYAGAGGRGTIGLKDTLQALNEQKIHILLVQQDFSHSGGECHNCGLLMLQQSGECPACGGSVTALENVVDAAIQKALELGSSVEVATEFGKLEPIENIGSIMYY